MKEIFMIYQYFYWNSPRNREKYAEKLENEKIELHDELKVKLRDKSGRYAYVLELITISISTVIFSILGKLEIVDNSQTIILFLGGYFVFQYAFWHSHIKLKVWKRNMRSAIPKIRALNRTLQPFLHNPVNQNHAILTPPRLMPNRRIPSFFIKLTGGKRGV